MKIREKVSMDPAKQLKKEVDIQKEVVPTPSEHTPAKTPSEAASTISRETAISSQLPAASPPNPDPTPFEAPKPGPAARIPLVSPDYSRKFLTGRLLHPSTHYTSLPPHTTTTSLHRILSWTPTQILLPLSGPGGRIALLSFSSSGRHESPPNFSTGAPLVDFEACAYAESVVTAGQDGVVKLWELGEGTAEERMVLRRLEKVIQVAWHPFVEGLIAILGVETGNTVIRLWESTASDGDGKCISLDYSVAPSISGVMVGVEYCVE